MTLQQLPTDRWPTYFDELSARMHGLQVDIEVAGFDIGDQMRANHAQLKGIIYDLDDSVLQIAVEGYLHVLADPQVIAIDIEGERVRSIAATDRQGRTHEVRFRKPLAHLGS